MATNAGYAPRYGSVRLTAKQRFNAFDQLPKAVRKALSEGEVDWAPTSILRTYRKLQGPDKAKVLIGMLQEGNRNVHRDAYPGLSDRGGAR